MDMIKQDHIGIGIGMIHSDHIGIGIGMVVSVEPYSRGMWWLFAKCCKLIVAFPARQINCQAGILSEVERRHIESMITYAH